MNRVIIKHFDPECLAAILHTAACMARASRSATNFVGGLPVGDREAVQTGSPVWELSNTKYTRKHLA